MPPDSGNNPLDREIPDPGPNDAGKHGASDPGVGDAQDAETRNPESGCEGERNAGVRNPCSGDTNSGHRKSNDAAPAGTPIKATGDDLLSQAFFRDRDVSKAPVKPGHTRKVIFSRLAKYVLPIIICLVVVDLLVRTFLPPGKLLPYMQKEFAFYTEKIKRFQELPAPDVLFLGSSRMRDDLDSEVFAQGLGRYLHRQARVYNLGLAGAHMEEVYTLATSYLPDPPPPYVIIGFSGTEVAWPYHFTYASRFLWKLNNFTDYIARVPFDHFYVRHIEYYIEAQICKFWYLFAQRDALLNYITENLERSLDLDLRDVPDEMRDHARVRLKNEKQRKIDHVNSKTGYHPVLRQFKDLGTRLAKNPDDVQITNRREFNKDPNVLNSTSADVLRLIVPALEAKGCKVAIIETPTSPFMQKMNPVLHGPGFRRWMEGVAEELGVSFFAFPPTDDNGLDNYKYGDASHLSAKGAKHFARIVLEQLLEADFFDSEVDLPGTNSKKPIDNKAINSDELIGETGLDTKIRNKTDKEADK